MLFSWPLISAAIELRDRGLFFICIRGLAAAQLHYSSGKSGRRKGKKNYAHKVLYIRVLRVTVFEIKQVYF